MKYEDVTAKQMYDWLKEQFSPDGNIYFLMKFRKLRVGKRLLIH